jgi:monomeric isocitrate dehydrogenase
VPVLQAVYASMRGIVEMHNPSAVVALAYVDAKVKDALRMAAADAAVKRTALVLLPEDRRLQGALDGHPQAGLAMPSSNKQVENAS